MLEEEYKNEGEYGDPSLVLSPSFWQAADWELVRTATPSPSLLTPSSVCPLSPIKRG